MNLYGIKPNRRAGQNFLKDPESAHQFCDALEAYQQNNPSSKNCQIVEIGPGLGQITYALCERFDDVIAIEQDRRIFQLWQSKLKQPSNLNLIEGDATRFDFKKLAKDVGKPLLIVSNLPYSVGTIILKRILFHWESVDYALLTFQKEVALRLSAQSGNRSYGSLTVHVQTFCDVEEVFDLGKECFHPAPKVNSGVVGLRFLSRPRVCEEHLSSFEKMVQQLFLYRRKTLLNSMKQSKMFSGWEERAAEFLENSEHGLDVRVEKLSLDELYGLYQYSRADSATSAEGQDNGS